MATAIVYALAGMAQADSTTIMGSFNNTRSKGANHHNTTITQQTQQTQQTSHHKPGPGNDDGRPGAQAQGSLVKANITNEIKKTGDITSTISGGDDNQANAASIAVNGQADIKGSITNRVDKTGDITAMIKDGDGNQANAASIAVNGAVVDGQVINDVEKTGDITSMIEDGDNNQANAASISLN
jgi:hypothetical protein